MHGAVFVVDNRHRIVHGIVTGLVEILCRRDRIDRQVAFDVNDFLSRQPRLSPIQAAPHQHIDRPPVATVAFPSLAVRQHCSIAGHDNAGNSIQRVTVLASLKEICFHYFCGVQRSCGQAQ